MSNSEHLIENTIFAMKRGENLDEVLDSPLNADLLDQVEEIIENYI